MSDARELARLLDEIYASEGSGVCRDSAVALRTQSQEIERLRAERDALKQQAQQWAMEAKSQRSTVHEAYQCVTGGRGEPGDWNGAGPIRAALKGDGDE